jgi:hypothetical protein
MWAGCYFFFVADLARTSQGPFGSRGKAAVEAGEGGDSGGRVRAPSFSETPHLCCCPQLPALAPFAGVAHHCTGCPWAAGAWSAGLGPFLALCLPGKPVCLSLAWWPTVVAWWLGLGGLVVQLCEASPYLALSGCYGCAHRHREACQY